MKNRALLIRFIDVQRKQRKGSPLQGSLFRERSYFDDWLVNRASRGSPCYVYIASYAEKFCVFLFVALTNAERHHKTLAKQQRQANRKRCYMVDHSLPNRIPLLDACGEPHIG